MGIALFAFIGECIAVVAFLIFGPISRGFVKNLLAGRGPSS